MSTPTTTAALIEAMRATCIVADDAPAAPAEAQHRPWFVSLVQGFAGWLAGALLLVFAGLIFTPDTRTEILTIGVVLTCSAWALYFIDRDAVFLEQLALAFSIAGQFALAWAILKDVDSTATAALTLFALQCGVFLLMPNAVARIVATFFACIAWAYFVRFALWPGHGVDSFFDGYGHPRIPVLGAWTVPVGWLLTWAPVIALTVWLLVREAEWMGSGGHAFARPALTGALLGASLGAFTAEPVWFTLFGSEGASGQPLSWWSAFPLLSLALTLFVAHCAFRLRSQGLLGIAVFAALLRLSLFYYQYGTSLLWKSALMLVLGVALLAGGVALGRRAGQAA